MASAEVSVSALIDRLSSYISANANTDGPQEEDGDFKHVITIINNSQIHEVISTTFAEIICLALAILLVVLFALISSWDSNTSHYCKLFPSKGCPITMVSRSI